MTTQKIVFETMTPAHLDDAVALSRQVNWPNRSALMKLLRECAKFAVIREGNAVQAFAAIRAFGGGLVTAPVVARYGIEAKALIDFLLAHHQGKFVRIDTDVSTGLASWLAGRGLAYAGGGIMARRSGTARKEQKSALHHSYVLVSQARG